MREQVASYATVAAPTPLKSSIAGLKSSIAGARQVLRRICVLLAQVEGSIG
jgi:hypothetical protein